LADWQISNFIVGHKYRRGAWNLPHKFHLYLIFTSPQSFVEMFLNPAKNPIQIEPEWLLW
jgi:hypothetical protein